MDLRFTDEQRMLADSARAFANRHGREDPWPAMCALGWAELPTVTDLCIVCEALGSGDVVSPIIPSAVAAAATGNVESIATVAVLEPGMTDEWVRQTMAGGPTLAGTKVLVPWADRATTLVVATRDGLYAVKSGFRVRPHRSIGPEPLFSVAFEDAPAERLPAHDHETELRRMLDIAAVAGLADAVGAAARALDLTVQYAKDRHQFGRPIGSFQAVAHRCVDMQTDLDACRYLAYRAAWALDHDSAAELEVAAAKAYGNDALRRIFGHAHQVHGAIGFSTEHDLHRFTLRAKAFELSYGGTDRHLDRVATAIGLS